jgi:hypothetical protein
MAARISGFRRVARLHTLLVLAAVASAFGPHHEAAAQQGSGTRNLRSVMMRQGQPTVADGELVVPDGGPVERVMPRVVEEGRFDAPSDPRGVIVEGPADDDVIVEGRPGYGTPTVEGHGPYAGDGSVIEGGMEGGLFDGSYPPCGAPGCQNGCQHCMTGHDGRPWFNAVCEPVGLTQRLAGLLHDHCKDTCWTGRGDALILWRNAPARRPLYTTNPAVAPAAIPVLDAGLLESPAAGGGRLQLFRQEKCGDILEFGYLYGGQFFARQTRPFVEGGYLPAPPGIYGNGFDDPPLDRVAAQVTGSIQSAEINRRHALGESMQFLYGFRWLNWYESGIAADIYGAPDNLGADIYRTTTINNLWGGQIGLDTLLLRTSHGFRVEGIVKAGAYANNAGQNSTYLNLVLDEPPTLTSVTDNGWPASCSFVGEVGLTGVVPISHNWDFRFGYVGLWLTGLAQPFGQFDRQVLVPNEPVVGALSAVGTVIVQGVTLGLEGRW